MREENNIEFKREYTADIKKEVMAFANSSGGVIYVGRDDDGNIYPLSDMDGTLTQITNSVRDGLLPDVTMFVAYETTENGITITVREGTHKPYFLPEKGLKPSGVYVRQGASSVPANFEQIREMIKLTDGGKFETARSMTQDLTFNVTADEFRRCGVEFGDSQMRSAFDFLSLSNNLAASLSGLDRIEQYDYPEIAVREAMLKEIVA